jgi:hypothetical protein
MSFDVVIPFHSKDLDIISNTIDGIKKNLDYINIYTIGAYPLKRDDVIFVNENIFPYKEKLSFQGKRASWYFQQLVKLTAWKYIKLTRKYLVVDSDCVFLKKVEFLNKKQSYLTIAYEYNLPYFEHMKKLHPEFERSTNHSGVAHHMFFDTKYIKEIIKKVEKHHKISFIKSMINSVEKGVISGYSEYEIYFHYMYKFHRDKVILRNLNWKNSCNFSDLGYDYICCHNYS